MSVLLEKVTKQFGRHTVVDRTSLDVAEGELFVLLGASGSGKSTILRLIAGLTPPTAGRILLHGRDVTPLPPQQRSVGFVFQNYSIFRHMNVAENIEFGLKIRNIPSAKRAERREELLDLVGLAGLGNRRATQLSGGQQQRVALARALAYEPKVLLLDEPFGALDAKIRVQLRRNLKEIQQRLGVTTILVTHDQEEAFEVADRIGVVERGQLLEVGEAETLYAKPDTFVVATFLGAGTLLAGRAEAGNACLGPLRLPVPEDTPHEDGAFVRVLIRPEHVVLSETAPAPDLPVLGKGTIVEQNFSGALRRVRLRVPRLAATRQVAPSVPFGEDAFLIDAVMPADTSLAYSELWISFRRWHILAASRWRLLVLDAGAGPVTHLQLTQQLVERLQASATLLGVAADAEQATAMRPLLGQRQHESGLSRAELRIRSGGAAEQIAIEKHETLYDLLILPWSDRPDLHPRRLGGTAMQIAENADLPVLITKSPQTTLQKMLICTAVGEPGKQDIQIGGRLARRLGARVTVLHVASNPSAVSPLTRAHLQRAERTLRGLDIECEVQIRGAASPASGILTEVEAGGYDVVVIGSHGPVYRSVFSRDDVTLQVLAGSDVAVLVVPARLD
jgi:sulfate transport system ATP-binding protein